MPPAPVLIDSHCHLDYFTPMELPEVAMRPTRRASRRWSRSAPRSGGRSAKLPPMTEAYPNLWCTVGASASRC